MRLRRVEKERRKTQIEFTKFIAHLVQTLSSPKSISKDWKYETDASGSVQVSGTSK